MGPLDVLLSVIHFIVDMAWRIHVVDWYIAN